MQIKTEFSVVLIRIPLASSCTGYTTIGFTLQTTGFTLHLLRYLCVVPCGCDKTPGQKQLKRRRLIWLMVAGHSLILQGSQGLSYWKQLVTSSPGQKLNGCKLVRAQPDFFLSDSSRA